MLLVELVVVLPIHWLLVPVEQETKRPSQLVVRLVLVALALEPSQLVAQQLVELVAVEAVLELGSNQVVQMVDRWSSLIAELVLLVQALILVAEPSYLVLVHLPNHLQMLLLLLAVALQEPVAAVALVHSATHRWSFGLVHRLAMGR